MRRKLLRRLPLLVIALLVIWVILGLDDTLHTVTYRIPRQGGTSFVRLAVITDLHSCSYGAGQQELLEMTEAQNPDLILLGGDIFDDKLPWDNAVTTLQGLVTIAPCYYVSGNHECMTQQLDEIKQQAEACGVTVLDGDCARTVVHGVRVSICGIDDPSIGMNQMQDQLAAAEKGARGVDYRILLAHRPEYYELYQQYDFDLIVSGHAHGGQWRVPGILNGVFSPGQGLFPKYAGGLYQLEKSRMVVSRGLAKESTRLPRLYNPPELVMVEIGGPGAE